MHAKRWIVLPAAVLAGAALGAASRVFDVSPDGRAAGALVAAFGLAVCAAAAWDAGAAPLRARMLGCVRLTATAFAAAWASAAAAGRADLLGGAAVVAGAAVAAHGIASLLRAVRAGPGHAVFGGAAAAAMTAGLVFVADPFVEWNAGGPGSLERARAVTVACPIASIAADAGIDWQRSRWMYDGPAIPARGLSVIGQFYPSRATDAFAWAAAAAVAGFLVLGLSAVAEKRPT